MFVIIPINIKEGVITEKRICVSCGKQFVIEDKEKQFYIKNGLTLPKRCKSCREKSKKVKNAAKRSADKKFLVSLTLLGVAAANIFTGFSYYKNGEFLKAVTNFCIAFTFFLVFCIALIKKSKKPKTEELIGIMNEFPLGFSNPETFLEHYNKHKDETKSHSPREYLSKANRVVSSKKSLKKTEKEDGDMIYFDSATGEIVFVSKFDKIRTYYVSDYDYFKRQ